ncbi:VWA domain-containing protein [Ktedonosporobacter rubrisoli]|nr:VWA domain-containing protein [Ktedonosporobacter rubrisoli]
MFCPACGSKNREAARFCARCGNNLPTPGTALPSRKGDELLRQLDLCIVMDATGSMQDYIEMTRKNLQAFVQKLSLHPVQPQLAYGLVLYRDHPATEKNWVTRRYAFTEQLDDLQQALNEAHAKGGGGDGAEAVVDGLYDACYVMKWRENAHKVILLAGDAPPHGWGNRRDRYPKGCPCEPEHGTVISIAQNARQRGITIFSLGIGDNQAMQKSFEQIAGTSGGRYVPIKSAGKLIDEVLSIMLSEVGKVEIDQVVYRAYQPGATPQAIAALTGLKIGDVDESMNRLHQKRMLQ